MQHQEILIGHGSGGNLSRNLIHEIFVKHFSNQPLNQLGDASWLTTSETKIAFTTDSYVIDPLFFPGGDIGKLAVSGTVNDLAVSGAIPKYLSAGFIIEEGFSISDLDKIAQSMAREAENANVQIVTGDTKVVKRGQCDKLFINTSGIGVVPQNRVHLEQGSAIEAGDKIIVSGYLGDHAIAVLSARENLSLDETILSDVAPLNGITEELLKEPENIRLMRDITRGGLATVLNELCEGRKFGIQIYENKLPVRTGVQSVCELFGFDPLYLANEGKMVAVVKNSSEEKVLKQLRKNALGSHAAVIGTITEKVGRVSMQSVIGGTRIVNMLSGEMLPRIC